MKEFYIIEPSLIAESYAKSQKEATWALKWMREKNHQSYMPSFPILVELKKRKKL